MNRSELYQLTKNLATELGLPTETISSRWNQAGSNRKYWLKQSKKLQKNIKTRERNFNRALKVSRINKEPLRHQAVLRGTDNKFWVRELRRLRMRGRRNPNKIKRIMEERAKVPSFRKAIQNVITTRTAQRTLNQQFNTLLQYNRFQQVLTLVVSGAKLNNQQTANFISKIMTDPRRFVITITLDSGETQKIPFNNNTESFIREILTQGFKSDTLQSHGSDTIESIITQGIQDILIEEYVYTGTAQAGNTTGMFFPFINTTELDLSRYQIFNQNQAYDKNTHKNMKHCFIQALEHTGLKESLINTVVLAIETGAHFAKKHIKVVAEKIKRRIIIHTYTKDQLKKAKYGEGEELNVALYQGHYFAFEKTIYTRFFADNYMELKDATNAHNVTRLSGSTGNPIYGTAKKLNSLTLIKILFDNKHFKPLDMKLFAEASTHKETRNTISLDVIDDEQKEMEEIKIITNKRKIHYADTETFTKGEKHQLFMIGYCGEGEDWSTVYTVSQKEPAQKTTDNWLKTMIKRGDKDDKGKNKKADVICYFHNLKYDYNILEPYLKVQSKVEKDGQLYSVSVRMDGHTVEFRDSLKMIPFALHKFGKEFSLPKHLRKKEAIAYDYYKPNKICDRITVEEYSTYLSKKDKKLFLNEIVPTIESFDPVTRTFSPYWYYVEYLKMDCEVLRAGMEAFNRCVTLITNSQISAYDCLTISSLTDKYAITEGAYEGIYQVTGNLREYINKAVYGGRVCVNKKYKKKVITGKISDYDGVSLYPSSIYRLCREMGFPKGKAKRFIKEQLNTWQQKDYSILTVKITAVNKHQQMPFIAHKGDGIINYNNEIPDEPIVIDKTTLEDYIKFHDIEYELIDGVYWDEGFNTKMGDVIQRLFDERLRHKKLGNNATQNALKLMMNSAYGKTIMKKSKSEKTIIKRSDMAFKKGKWEKIEADISFRNYIWKNFHIIKSFRMVNEHFYEVEQLKADFSYNRGHIGCSILSMSKRIMNEVFDVANDNEYPIYYQDTDSLHIDLENVPKLEEAYGKKYKRELNGKQLGQFHTDFNLAGAKGEIYATKSIFLGKKSYIDVLESVDTNGDKIKGHHVRLKGITEAGMKHSAKKHGSFEKLYESLAKGIPETFVLNPYDEDEETQKVMFQYVKGGVMTRKEFCRRVRF